MNRRAFSMIEVLLAMVIIAILLVILLPRLGGGKDPLSGKRIASPKQRAQGVQGVSYLSQITQAITLYKMDNDDQPPPSLMELRRYGITPEMLIEPVSKKPFVYNPQTGQVSNPY